MHAIDRLNTRRNGRGIALILVLLFVVLLLIMAIGVLFVANAAAGNTSNVQDKNQAFNAAETGLNTALDTLDNASAATACAGGTVNSHTYTCGIVNNYNGATTKVTTDPTGRSVTIPVGFSLVYGIGNALASGRTVTVEAIVTAPRPGLVLPPGAVIANKNVTGSGDIPVRADPLDSAPHDANVFANGSVAKFATSVDGLTYGVGSNSMPGWNGTTYTGAQYAVSLPNAAAVNAFASKALATAQAGTTLTAAQFLANGTHTYNGNLYINGTVSMSSNTVTLTGGGTIYVNGALCLSGSAKLLNTTSSLIVVSQQAAIVAGSYAVNSATHGVLVALGTNATPSCGQGGNPFAIAIGDGSAVNLGLLYAPNGSTTMSGNGTFTGAFIAGVNADFQGGGNGLALNYDSGASGAFNQRNAAIQSYVEY